MGWILVLALGCATPELLTVRVFSTPEVSRALVIDGLEISTAVLRQACVSPLWLRCPADAEDERRCAAPVSADEVIVRMQRGRSPAHQKLCGETLFMPAGRSQLVTIDPACVDDVADVQDVPDSIVFAYTLIHEIGHVLLGSRHRPLGIMQKFFDARTWQNAVQMTLTFNGYEADSLKRAIARRHAQINADDRE